VQRGKCEFVKKVREAQRLGARAIVVGGENPDISGYPDTLVNMYSPGMWSTCRNDIFPSTPSTEDSSDVKIAATYIKYSDYTQLLSLIKSSNTSHSGLRTLSLLITAEYSAWEWYSCVPNLRISLKTANLFEYRPIITFVVILLLPSALTFITLLIHRIRAARAAQRDRAPEDIVHSLPWHVWTGTGWEKHEGSEPIPDTPARASLDLDLVENTLPFETSPDESLDNILGDSSTSDPSKSLKPRPWFETQAECAICLSDFVKGDKVRVLPCHHIFHLDEVDEWLIQRKKLVSLISLKIIIGC
jgi:hypothetical protein